MLKIMALSLFISLGHGVFSSVARAAEPACYTQEVNPATRRIFVSEKVYQNTLAQWQTQAPAHPGFFNLAKAYSVYSKEKNRASKMRDKRAHCYVGCRISQETDYRTAEYVGWLKEDRDIRDCKKVTHFDPADVTATNEGGRMGQSASDADSCLQMCGRVY